VRVEERTMPRCVQRAPQRRALRALRYMQAVLRSAPRKMVRAPPTAISIAYMIEMKVIR